MIEAVVFDMDGVLLDTEKVYRKCWIENGRTIGIPEEEMQLICNRLAGGTKKTNANVMKERMGQDFDYLAFRAKTMELFDAHIAEYGIELKHGVFETLKSLRNLGIKLAVATSTEREAAEDRLTKAGLISYFDVIICGNDIERGKPYPDIYITACKQLEVEPSKAIGVEDSINGVISCSDAGLCTVMVVDLIEPNEVVKTRAKHIFHDIHDVALLAGKSI